MIPIVAARQRHRDRDILQIVVGKNEGRFAIIWS